MSEANGTPEDKAVGQILMEMGVCSREQVTRAVGKQSADSEDERVGMYLVAMGFITEKQLRIALNAQVGLRSKKKHTRALAMSDIAEAATVSNISRARAVRARTDAMHRSAAGTGDHTPVPTMVAKGEDG